MPRPRSLTGPGIAAAALAVVDRDGLSALTMRSVAVELGVGTMSLYRYVDDRQALEDLVAELVLAGVPTDVPPEASWPGKVTILAERVRAAVGRHPDVVPLLLTRRHATVATRRWGEAVLGALAEGGFEGADRVIAFRTILSYVLGAVQVEHQGALSGPGTAALADQPAEFPLLAATAGAALGVSADEEFGRGLAIVLRGVSTTDA